MMNELIDAFDRADADDAVRAVIVTGAGRAFCAGADLSAGIRTFDYEARDDRPDRKVPPRDPSGQPDWSHESMRDGGGRVVLRICGIVDAGDRRGQRAGLRHRRDDAAADGHSARQHHCAFRLVFTRRGIPYR